MATRVLPELGAPDPVAVARVVRLALEEDVGAGDLTSTAVVAAGATCEAVVVAKQAGVVCGLFALPAVFSELDAAVEVELVAADGQAVGEGVSELARLHGPARAIVTGERVALNLLGRLSGIASTTRKHVDAVAGTAATVLDTRKTTAGLRALEKYAVRCGGGTNHRLGLFDAILIKDNHKRLAGGVGEATRRAVAAAPPGVSIEVECETLDEVAEALAAGATRILLDNMTLVELRAAVSLTGGRALLEASGGVTLDTIRSVAETGVDFVSVGALTHSPRALDVSLEVLR